jgi:hypothetical protein
MTKILSYIFGGLLLVALIFGGQTLYSKWQLQDVNNELNKQLMEANLEIGKGKTRFGNAQERISELDSSLRTEITRNNELLVAYGELEAKYEAVSGGTGTGTITPVDSVELGGALVPGQWYVATTKDTLVSIDKIDINYSDFRLDISSTARPGKTWENYLTKTQYNLHMNLFGQIVQSVTKSGATNHYINLWELNNRDERVGKLELDRFEIVVQKPEQKEFFLWAPHVDLGAFFGTDIPFSFFGGASIGFTSSGYGLTKNDLSWKFFRLGADITEETVGVSFSPAQYRISDLLPLVSNLYIGPYVSMFTNGNKSLGLILTVGL